MSRRSDELPKKFRKAERRAYDWLYDCGIRPWTVDLATKRVRTPTHDYNNLVDFARAVKQAALRRKIDEAARAAGGEDE